ncbi:MAG TPA: hypothetical protein D7H92_06465 [Candidatus Poseidoniales archaeon]|nr:MAG TPA: hypothetical protein D7H92_06465 [Candidatus Poseidoniales archaeon]
MFDLMFLLSNEPAIGKVQEKQTAQHGETLCFTNFLEGQNTENKPYGNEDEVLEYIGKDTC